MCPFFKHLVKKIVNHLQEKISKKLHNHSFINIFSYLSFDSHQTCLKSCVRLGADVWLIAHLVILFFHLPLSVFSTALHTRLDFPHHLVIRGVTLHL
jgi:hypothetical protein